MTTICRRHTDCRVYARIIDAHYASAERADEARRGAAFVRRFDAIVPGYRFADLASNVRTLRAERVNRDFGGPTVPINCAILRAMPTTSATQQTEEN